MVKDFESPPRPAEPMPMPAPVAAAPPPLRIIFLLVGEWNGHGPGKVLAVDPDVLAAMDADGVQYRDADAFERSIGGFPADKE